MTAIDRCVVLAGGTGGPFAVGIQDVLGEGLAVIANTADDVELLGVDVSPDPDLVTYWLADEIDEQQGWGIKGDSSTVFERLVQLGAPTGSAHRPRPRNPLPIAPLSSPRGKPHRRPGPDRQGAGRARTGAADVRGDRPHPRPAPPVAGGVCRSSWSPTAASPRSRPSRSRGSPTPCPRPRCSLRSTGRTRS